MTGVVTDLTGALIPGTAVTLSNSRTGVSFTQSTDNKGTYRFANVPPAQGYTVSFAKSGFVTMTVQNIALQVGITRTQDATLHAGANQTIEVSGRSSEVTLNTTDASVGNNIDPVVINELPVQNRDSPSVLFSLQPGVADNSVTGARVDQTSVTLDGMDVNDIAAGSGLGSTIVGGAPVDAVQEFRGLVAGLTPNVGTGSGGQFQLVTRSGTNSFHGDLNEYHRDTSTAANAWFNNNAGIPRPKLIRNQFGGAIGGPIKRDKLFFFFDFNNSRIIQSAQVSRTVPLDSFRAGNISYIRATDSVTGAACAASSRQNTTPNCIGMLTPAQVQAMDPLGKGEDQDLLAFINQRYPHANDLTGGNGVNTGLYRFNFPEPNTLYNYVARVDYNITPRQRLFVRFNIDRRNSVQAANEFPTDPGITNPFVDRSYGYVISHVWQIGSNKVNQAYYGDNITKYDFPSLEDPTGTAVYSFGGSTTSNNNLSGPYPSPSSQKRRVPIPMIRDDFNWRKGSHSLGFGGTFKFIKTNSQLVNDFNFITVGLGGEKLALDAGVRPANIRGGTTAPGQYDAAFALALGRIGAVSSNYNYTASGSTVAQGTGAIRRYRYFQTELYAGDTWKVNRQLTLTYGLRYQLYTVPYEANGEESIQNTTFDQYFAARLAQSAGGKSGPGTLPFITYSLGGKANNAPTLYKPSYKDFAPRFAFAYNPAFAPKTVFNAGAGIVFDRTVINAVNFIQDQSSYLFQNSAGTQYGSASTAAGALAADPRLGTKLAFTNPNTAPTITKPFTPFVDNPQGTDPNDPFGVPNSPYGLATNQFNDVVDPNLKDPYSITLNAGMQQELPSHFLLKLNYAGRLGRRLLAQTDASQLIDFPDPASGQTMAQAFAALTLEARAGLPFTKQPWFENQVGPGYTIPIAKAFSSLVSIGDFADTIQALQADGLLDYNVGMASQFAENTFLTNKGFSSYNGMLVTLTHNLSQGLQFDVNYTWSHSIDNMSAPANYISSSSGTNFVCDAVHPRECRANSDFDVQNVINSDILYQLPFGRGRTFAGHTSRALDELIGGWNISAIPAWRSGLALTAFSNAFVAGYANDAPAIFNGNRTDVQAHVKKDPTSGSVYLFGSQAAAAKAQSDFTGPIGLTIGSRNVLRGPSAFSMDAGLAKDFAIVEDVRLRFRADFFNVLNHPVFSLPANDITAGNFGQITGTDSTARVGQFSLRLEF